MLNSGCQSHLLTRKRGSIGSTRRNAVSDQWYLLIQSWLITLLTALDGAIALAAATRGSAREIVLVNRTRKVAEAVSTDLRYGIPLGPRIDISDGDYDALNGAGVLLITSGVNEKTGGATDRSDPQG